jgi:hypothetical protein
MLPQNMSPIVARMLAMSGGKGAQGKGGPTSIPELMLQLHGQPSGTVLPVSALPQQYLRVGQGISPPMLPPNLMRAAVRK